MFAKLRTAKYMKARANSDEAVVEFAGKVQRMVRVHHYGLRDRPSRGQKEVQYDKRPLLGLRQTELTIIENAIVNALIYT